MSHRNYLDKYPDIPAHLACCAIEAEEQERRKTGEKVFSYCINEHLPELVDLFGVEGLKTSVDSSSKKTRGEGLALFR
jgi:hypothetical protein